MWRCNFCSKWWFSIAMLVFRGVHLQSFAFILPLILLRSNHTKSSCNSDGPNTWCDSNTSTKRWFRLHILSQLGSIIPLVYQIHIPYLAFRSYFIWSHGFPETQKSWVSNSLNSWKFWVSPLLDTQKKIEARKPTVKPSRERENISPPNGRFGKSSSTHVSAGDPGGGYVIRSEEGLQKHIQILDS